ncbi:MAG: hypothetical protein ABSA23_00250 [Anaerolineales bacterium]|jgi:hypothetical protein
MGIEIPLFQGLSLNIGDAPPNKKAYPTASLQKGFILMAHGQALAEEAVGFGVPVLKCGLQTIFPGSVTLNCLKHETSWNITALFKLDLVERISKADKSAVKNKFFYVAKDGLAALIRFLPILRGPLTAISSQLRRSFNWETIYTPAGFSTGLKVLYQLDTETGRVGIEIDPRNLPPEITEVMVMNEQGAYAFDRYQDTSGILLQGQEIGCWDEVNAQEAWFESTAHRVAFRLCQVKGARLFRGRELVGSRLAWAGFGYSFSPSIQSFRYEIRIEKRP